MKKIIVLGATGSIGRSTVEIAREFSDKIEIVGLSAHKNESKLKELGIEFNTNNLALTGINKGSDLPYLGPERVLDMIKVTSADIVVNGIAGSSGLLPSVTAIKSGKDLALANKETMVMAGGIINKLATKHNIKLLPVDSEHSAIFHLLEECKPEDLDEIILTASGGAFRDLKKEQLSDVTLEDALKHPTWSMGTKITIDSASMANKGLEVIEAAMLFNIKPEKIKVLIHPQSYVHSLIRKKDNSMYAQISGPDMKLPIQNAIFYPELYPVSSTLLELAGKSLDFKKPDMEKYQMLDLAYKALNLGDSYCIAYNAANEELVESFTKREISFLDIGKYTKEVLDKPIKTEPDTLDNVLKIDSDTRLLVKKILGKRVDN